VKLDQPCQYANGHTPNGLPYLGGVRLAPEEKAVPGAYLATLAGGRRPFSAYQAGSDLAESCPLRRCRGVWVLLIRATYKPQ
jgi:hypothetical protein